MRKSKKGITLVALIITIIVLVMIAGVSLAFILGENGISSKAMKAQGDTNVSQEKEYINLAYSTAIAGGLNITDTKLQSELDNIVGKNKTEVTMVDDETFNVLFCDSQRSYLVGKNDNTITERKELHIHNYNELLEFANMVNSGNSMREYIVYLDNNIDMGNEPWCVIGYPTTHDELGSNFSGKFEGNNNTISGLYVTNGDNHAYRALFCYNSGTIQNLNLQATIEYTGSWYGYTGAAGIAANNYGIIHNCTVEINNTTSSSAQSHDAAVGGIAGGNDGTISDCTVRGTISGSAKWAQTGGIAGTNSGTIINCVNEAEIIGLAAWSSGNSAGGICGENRGTIEKCINRGNLNISCWIGGGLAGESLFGAQIKECANFGNLTTDYASNENYAPTMGGICGKLWSASITDCYNAGTAYKDNTNAKCHRAAGIVANYQDTTSVQNCYNIGAINSNVSYSPRALFGSESITGINCYYDTTASISSDDVGTGLSTEEMKASNFAAQLGDAYTTDTNNINNGYPVLRWQSQ